MHETNQLKDNESSSIETNVIKDKIHHHLGKSGLNETETHDGIWSISEIVVDQPKQRNLRRGWNKSKGSNKQVDGAAGSPSDGEHCIMVGYARTDCSQLVLKCNHTRVILSSICETGKVYSQVTGEAVSFAGISCNLSATQPFHSSQWSGRHCRGNNRSYISANCHVYNSSISTASSAHSKIYWIQQCCSPGMKYSGSSEEPCIHDEKNDNGEHNWSSESSDYIT